MRTALAVFAAVLAAAAALACASARVRDIENKGRGPLPKPPVLLVYDFAFDPSHVDVDRWGLNVASAPAPTAAQRKLGQYITTRFSEALVKDLERRKIHAQRAVASTPVPLNALCLRGVFVSIKEGSALARTLVGFGWGTSAVEARTQLYQQSAKGPVYLGKGEVTAHGSKAPGSGVKGAAKQSVTGLVFKGATTAGSAAGLDENLPTALKEGVKADVERAAKAIADRAEQGYRKRGWL